MNISSQYVNFGYRRTYLPLGNYPKVKSLVDNLEMMRDEIWKDVAEYRKLHTNLSKRKLTNAEKDTFVHLPNVEVKRMYLEQILKPLKRGRKPKAK